MLGRFSSIQKLSSVLGSRQGRGSGGRVNPLRAGAGLSGSVLAPGSGPISQGVQMCGISSTLPQGGSPGAPVPLALPLGQGCGWVRAGVRQCWEADQPLLAARRGRGQERQRRWAQRKTLAERSRDAATARAGAALRWGRVFPAWDRRTTQPSGTSRGARRGSISAGLSGPAWLTHLNRDTSAA